MTEPSQDPGRGIDYHTRRSYERPAEHRSRPRPADDRPYEQNTGDPQAQPSFRRSDGAPSAADLISSALDGWAVFAATPTPYLLLTPEYVICGANEAYLRATSRKREELIGRYLFDAFPDNPDDPHASGVRNLHASLERARATGKPDSMAIQQYDIVVGEGPNRQFEERYWSPINTPVLDEHGKTVLLIHRVVDVTAYMEEGGKDWERAPTEDPPDPVHLTAADVYARAQELQRVNEQLRRAYERERRIALTLQEAMLPAPVTIEGARIVTRYLPSTDVLQVGGDWYDVIDLGDGRFGLTVGDVMGHGLPAAAFMGQMRSALGAATLADPNPAGALDVLDTYARSVEDSLFATTIHVVIDLARRTLTYSAAGHPPALLLTDTGRFLDQATAPPLGATPESFARSQAVLCIPEPATLVLYSDGIIERRDRDIDEGLRLLRERAERHAHLDIEAFADALLHDLVPDESADDDLVLVVARL